MRSQGMQSECKSGARKLDGSSGDRVLYEVMLMDAALAFALMRSA
jgi:hypothetical protein